MLRHILALLACSALSVSLPASAADFDAASAINQTGLDLYRQLAAKNPDGNLVLSPYSIESALALAYAGAEGVTREEMSAALHLPRDEVAVRRSFAGLRTALTTLATESTKLAVTRSRSGPDSYAIVGGKRVELQGEPAVGIEWHEANRLFAQRDYAFRDSFLTLMRDSYAAPLEALDFRRDIDKSRAHINGWVAEQTKGKIRDVVPPGGVSSETRLVLVNALYLNAPWDTPFEKSITALEPFHRTDGTKPSVPTMQRGGYLGHARENGLTVVSLDYLGRGLQCLILLPDETISTESAAVKLKAADFVRWSKLGQETRSTQLVLHLPKFRVEGATLRLGSHLRLLGVRSAFDEPERSANFDRIAPRRPDNYLKISEVFHRTFIALDEEGTEAAAATAVSMAYAAGVDPRKPIEVRVDRPFLFAIQHRASGACLFLGRIVDPR